MLRYLVVFYQCMFDLSYLHSNFHVPIDRCFKKNKISCMYLIHNLFPDYDLWTVCGLELMVMNVEQETFTLTAQSVSLLLQNSQSLFITLICISGNVTHDVKIVNKSFTCGWVVNGSRCFDATFEGLLWAIY